MTVPAPDLPADCLLVRLAAGTRLFRIHWRGKDPIWFGPAPGALPGNRFDAPAGEYGTLYVAEALKGAYAETILRKAERIIAWPIVEKRSWSVLELQRDVDVALLHGDGLGHHGVTSDICTGDDYGSPQALSLAFYSRGIEGIVYRSRHNNDQICYALFNLIAASDLKVIETHHFADAPAVAQGMMGNAKWDPLKPLPDLTGSL